MDRGLCDVGVGVGQRGRGGRGKDLPGMTKEDGAMESLEKRVEGMEAARELPSSSYHGQGKE